MEPEVVVRIISREEREDPRREGVEGKMMVLELAWMERVVVWKESPGWKVTERVWVWMVKLLRWVRGETQIVTTRSMQGRDQLLPEEEEVMWLGVESVVLSLSNLIEVSFISAESE